MRLRNWAVVLAILFIAQLVWYLLYTRQIVQALKANAEAFDVILTAIEKAGYKPGEQIGWGLNDRDFLVMELIDGTSLTRALADGIIEAVSFDGAGCAISTASASLMTEAIKGKTEQQARELFQSMHRLLTEAAPAAGLGKLAVLGGVHEYPMRIKCATLSWNTLSEALAG